MSKKISFETEEEKADAIAEEKTQHPTPTEYQKQHLAELEGAVVGE